MLSNFIVNVVGKYGVMAMGDYSGRLRHGVALGTLMLAMASPAFAQQQPAARAGNAEQSLTLDPIVVQGEGKAAAPLVEGPTTTTTTREELDRTQVQSLSDFSNRIEAGIGFGRSNSSLNIRGLDGNRVLTTIDGIRLPYLDDNTRQARGGGNSFDFDSLSTLDLLRGGSGGATLGGNALGGALAVRTLDPEDLIRGGRNFGALAKTGYDSTDRSWFGSAAVAARLQNTYFLLQGGYRNGHETESRGTLNTFGPTRTAPNPADTKQYSVLAKIHHYVDEVHRFGLTGEFFKREEDIDTRTLQAVGGNYQPGQHRSGEDVERKRVSLSYDYKYPGGFLDEAHAVLYWQDVKRNSLVDAYRSTSLIGPYLRDNEFQQQAFGFNGNAVKKFQTGPLSHTLTFGTELRITESTQYSAGVDVCRRPYTGAFAACNNLHTNQADMPKVDGRMIGLFVHDEIGLLDNRLRVTPGVRFDWYEEKPKETPEYTRGAAYSGSLPRSSTDQALSPRLRIEYDVLPKLTAFAQWSKGFRAPSVSELYGVFGAVGTYLRQGNPDLRPETSNGIDLGVRFGDSRLGGSVTVFHTNYRNFIDTVQLAPPGGLYPQAGITGYENLARVRMRGIEANAHVKFDENWTLRGSFAYTHGKNEITAAYIDSVPPMQGIIGLAYATSVWGAEVSTKLAGPRKDVNVGFKAPGYAFFNATAWWKPIQTADLELQVGVYNIFDTKYFDVLNIPTGVLAQPRDYYSEPGRTIKTTLKYQF